MILFMYIDFTHIATQQDWRSQIRAHIINSTDLLYYFAHVIVKIYE